jgi:hypothetical protein
MTPNLNIFLVTFDKFEDKAIVNLTEKEIACLTCYSIQKKIVKNISKKIVKIVNEWELPWNDYKFQNSQYYEYGAFIHLYNNQEIIQDLTHVGLMHYDMLFNKNSVNDMIVELSKTPETIFYQQLRPKEQLSLSRFEVDRLCEFMSDRMSMLINPDSFWNIGWISECLSVTPKNVFLKFGKFLNDNHEDIEKILRDNTWGIMNICPHRICGIIERMWGFYLMSNKLPVKPMNVIHDWDSYIHHHMSMNGTGLSNLK